MENRDLFTMRELGDRDLEQFNSLLKYAFQVTSDEMLKTGWQEDEMKYSKAPMLKNAFVLGWFHGENLASQIVIYPMEMNIEGEPVRDGRHHRCSYLSGICRTRPDPLADERMSAPHAGKTAVYLHSLPLFHSLLPEDGLGSGIG